MDVNILDTQGSAVGTAALPDLIFGIEPHATLVHQAVIRDEAGQRLGTASTKTRSEVRGGGRKPWRQKHTGRARHGSRRSPIWRTGGVTFGPPPQRLPLGNAAKNVAPGDVFGFVVQSAIRPAARSLRFFERED